MKLSQLSLADYNQLDSIPVINQDLSASGFTPTANTYYRHTGATTATFTQGVIYLYDTAYHKLGESGGDYLTYTAHLVSGDTRFDDTTYDFIISISDKIVYAETATATLSRPNIHSGITFSARKLFNGSDKEIIDYTLYISSAKYASVYSVTVKPDNTVTYQKMDINNFIGTSGITFYYTA